MQIAPTKPEDIKPLLRPDAAETAQRDIKAAEAKLASPYIEDKGEVRKQLMRLKKTTQEQLPRAPASAEEEGQMVARSKELLEHIVTDGMLSQAEMRACPPGAPDLHLAWERRNKAHILEWKNLQLRLRPGEREAANLERHRPTANRLNLDNAVVDRRQFFNIDQVSGPTVTLNDEELIALQALAPDIHASVGSLSNDERAVIKRLVSGMLTKPDSAQKESKKH